MSNYCPRLCSRQTRDESTIDRQQVDLRSGRQRQHDKPRVQTLEQTSEGETQAACEVRLRVVNKELLSESVGRVSTK
jgi:hypothetical protein